MVKARGEGENGPVYVLGLSSKNLEKLRDNKPIVFDMAELGSAGTMVILWGETEEEIAKDFEKYMPTPFESGN